MLKKWPVFVLLLLLLIREGAGRNKSEKDEEDSSEYSQDENKSEKYENDNSEYSSEEPFDEEENQDYNEKKSLEANVKDFNKGPNVKKSKIPVFKTEIVDETLKVKGMQRHQRFVEGNMSEILNIMEKIRKMDMEEKCGTVQLNICMPEEKDHDLANSYRQILQPGIGFGHGGGHGGGGGFFVPQNHHPQHQTVHQPQQPLAPPVTRIPVDEFKRDVVQQVVGYLTLGEPSSEDEVVQLATLQMRNSVNVGVVGGQAGLLRRPRMVATSCQNAFPIRCLRTSRYRTMFGLCNNLDFNPMWGSQGAKFERFLPAKYADSRNTPRGRFESARGTCHPRRTRTTNTCGLCETQPRKLLPNPRRVSVQFHLPNLQDDQFISVMFVIFGQFLDHDVTLTPEFEVEDGCCEGENARDGLRCFPIFHPRCVREFPSRARNVEPVGEGSLPGSTRDCISFARSSAFCNDTLSMREHVNALTSFVDASSIYGSTANMTANLRAFQAGLLRTGPNNLLPVEDANNVNTIQAGDERAGENIMLSCVHALFMREHNRLAQQFMQLLPNGNDELWFQEARRVVWAEYQSVVYNGFLPRLLGQRSMQRHSLTTNQRDQYDPTVNAGATNEFATAAFRFGHSGLPSVFHLADLRTNQQIGRLHRLQDHFFNVDMYNRPQGMDQILNGMLHQRAKSIDRHIVSDVLDFLFGNIHGIGQDLIARNIQRGRDHGIPGYNDYRQWCGMPKCCSFNEYPVEISRDNWDRLRQLYTDPSDIDLFVGGLAELPHEGGIVGRTFNCLIARQFNRFKFGDRFFYTFRGPEQTYPFTPQQINLLSRRTLSDIICDNTQIQRVPRDAFWFGSRNRRMLNCRGGGGTRINAADFAQNVQNLG